MEFLLVEVPLLRPDQAYLLDSSNHVVCGDADLFLERLAQVCASEGLKAVCST